MFQRPWLGRFKIDFQAIFSNGLNFSVYSGFLECNQVAKRITFVENFAMKGLFALIIFSLLFASCKKSDLTPPTVGEISVNNNTTDILEFQPGASFVIRTILEDNLALGQFKIDIHHDFDGHSHKSSTERYKEIRIKDIDGLTYNLEEEFTIPMDASSGTYHGSISALDAEGNVSEVRLFYFNIVRENQPTISMNLPQSVQQGSTFEVEGSISAASDTTLKTIKVRIVSTQTGNKIFEQTYNLPAATTTWNAATNGNISVSLPQEETEKLNFRIWVEDSNGNNTIFEAEIIIV